MLAVGPSRPPAPRRYTDWAAQPPRDSEIDAETMMAVCEQIVRDNHGRADGRLQIAVNLAVFAPMHEAGHEALRAQFERPEMWESLPAIAGAAHVPAIRTRKEGGLRHLVHVSHPVLLGIRVGLDHRLVAGAHVRQAAGHPFHVLFDGNDDVGQNRRAARAGNGEQVGKARHHPR